MTIQTTMPTEAIRIAAALQAASEMDDLKLGAVIIYASAAHACALKGRALLSAVADAFDVCAKRSVEAGDIRADDEPASADLDTTLFRYRRGTRTVLRACHGEGNLLSAAHTGRLMRLALDDVDASDIPGQVSAVEVPAQEIPEGYTIHAGTIRDDETGEDDTIYQWEHVSGEVSGHVRGDGAFVRDMFGSWEEALADIIEHSAPDMED